MPSPHRRSEREAGSLNRTGASRRSTARFTTSAVSS
nr:MAG TPA: hypothetical protein [Caudoviricetes sp.]